MTAPGYGPWKSDITVAERSARFREMHAIARLIVGPTHPLVMGLREAASNPDAAEGVRQLLDALPSRLHRRLLCTYAALWDAPK
jgi:hypothetical protein